MKRILKKILKIGLAIGAVGSTTVVDILFAAFWFLIFYLFVIWLLK